MEHSCFQLYDEKTQVVHIDDCNIAKICKYSNYKWICNNFVINTRFNSSNKLIFLTVEKNQLLSSQLNSGDHPTSPLNNNQSSQLNNPEDYNECLIAAVQARLGLYDHRIPVKERTSLKKKLYGKKSLMC